MSEKSKPPKTEKGLEGRAKGPCNRCGGSGWTEYIKMKDEMCFIGVYQAEGDKLVHPETGERVYVEPYLKRPDLYERRSVPLNYAQHCVCRT